MTTIYIIDDYTAHPIWDHIRARLGELATSPRTGDGMRHPTQPPTGDWRICHVMHPHALDSAYAIARIRQPAFDELPCIFAVQEPADGTRAIRECIHAKDTDKNLEFIAGAIA